MSDEKRKTGNIDYTAEGSTPPEKSGTSDTDRGYDEAVRSGESQYGTPEGHGGVFGTTGGGTFGGGMQIVERPVVYDLGDEDEDEKPNND